MFLSILRIRNIEIKLNQKNLLSCRCLEVLIEMQAAKIRRTIADIEVLQNAKLTSESRLSNIQEVSAHID